MTVDRPIDHPEAAGRATPDRQYTGGNPLVYALALVVVALTLGPVLYGVLGGFRTNAQLAETRRACPTRGCSTTTSTC